jgi:hypothetical protein
MVKLGMVYYWVARFTSKQSMNLLSTGVSLDPSVFGAAEPYPNQFYSWLSVLLEKKQKSRENPYLGASPTSSAMSEASASHLFWHDPTYLHLRVAIRDMSAALGF